MEKVIIKDIFNTTFADQTCWVAYRFMDKLGYEIINERNRDKKDRLLFLCNSNRRLNTKFSHKKLISQCSEYLQQIAIESLQSENEMLFVEYDEFYQIPMHETIMNNLQQEIVDLKLQDYIKFDEDGCAISVSGAIITCFLFD